MDCSRPHSGAVMRGVGASSALNLARRQYCSGSETMTMTGSGAKPPHGSILRIFGPAASSLMVASGLGFIYWVAAARLYTPEQVGTTGAAISLISWIGIAARGGLYAVLLRALAAHRDPGRLHLMTCATVAGVAGVAGLLAGLFHVGHASLGLEWLWFALLSAALALFTLQDAILISLRRTTMLFISNVGFGVAKLILLVAFAVAAQGIVTSWAVPLVIVVPIIAVVADRTIARLPARAIDTFTVTTEHVVTEYVSAVAVVAINSAVPVVVSSLQGGAFSGVVYVCWMRYIAADSLGTILSSVVVSSATEHDLAAARHGIGAISHAGDRGNPRGGNPLRPSNPQDLWGQLQRCCGPLATGAPRGVDPNGRQTGPRRTSGEPAVPPARRGTGDLGGRHDFWRGDCSLAPQLGLYWLERGCRSTGACAPRDESGRCPGTHGAVA